MKKTGPSNPRKKEVVKALFERAKTENKPIFKTIALLLNRPTRQGVKVNLDKISKYAKDNGNVIVPGKVLSTGDLTKKVTIIAYSFSQSALEKIAKNGKAITLTEFANKKMEAKGLQILK